MVKDYHTNAQNKKDDQEINRTCFQWLHLLVYV